MPKIKSIPGHNDSSFDVQRSPTNKFSRIDNTSKIKNAEYLTPIVPIHQVPYNPEFSKSPLASVQMSRKPHFRVADTAPNVQYNNYDTDYHVDNNRQYSSQKCDWKKILCWLLIALAIIGLAVGLYFLIDSLLSKKKNTNSAQFQTPNFNNYPKSQSYTGVNPVFVNPIPYNSIYSGYNNIPTSNQASAYTSPSNYNPSSNQKTALASNPTTYPQFSPSPPIRKQQYKVPASQQNSFPTSKPNQDNSIAPFDVYTK